MYHLNRSTASRPRRRSLLLGLAGAGLVLGYGWRASAQTEADTPAPNVLLLVDSSGSMEFKVDGTFPTCKPGDETVQEKSRWIDLVEVLTGKFQHYSCWAEDRSTTAFRNEFSLSGVTPYDFGYVNPYHRALSNSCLVGPGVLPAPNAFSWPNNAINTFALLPGNVVSRPASDAALAVQAPCAGFAQTEDGLLDVFKGQVRFGLMTFDARVNAGTGYSGVTADYASGTEGNWSYYLGTPASGHPANCSFEVDQEVGARNAAAPPWEGRMIAFGPPTQADVSQRNAWIQQTLMATRPYGATPLNGQLYDARDFLWNDNSSDPFDSTQKFGPKDDPTWKANDCRKTIMIVLSDGEPNLDLRPYCEATPPPPETAGRCPYPDAPEKVVSDLRLSPPLPNQSVETYVIGFALGKVTPSGSTAEVACGDVTDAQCADPKNNDFDKYPGGKAVQACCTLNKIAAAGGNDSFGQPRKAYFANDSTQLRQIFANILNGVIKAGTRTPTVFSSLGDSASRGFLFNTKFETKPEVTADRTDAPPDGLWLGQLERTRLVCDDSTLKVKPDGPTANKGDKFAENVNTHRDSRHFYTVLADTNIHNSIRPGVTTTTDGVGVQGGTTVYADTPDELPSQVQPGLQGMDLTDTSCAGYSVVECRDLVLKYALGTSDGQPSRCFNGNCSLFGAILHSTPTVVPGRPSDLLRDESYDAFMLTMQGQERPSTLYTSTVDGMLHAFKLAPFPGLKASTSVDVTDESNNEFWAFIPPAVLPALRAQYPTHAVLLDGVPIIKDVVAHSVGGSVRYERVAADAQTGQGEWRTILVQAFGEGQVNGGYFAMDITQPEHGLNRGPKFLWQLTRDASGRPLFGNGGTPLITTIYLEAGVGISNEVAVAVLPGGDLPPIAGTTPYALDSLDVTAGFESFRASGPNYTGAERARSLTIVRLDTGEVLRTFRPSVTGFSAAVHTSLNLPSPITGQPKAFPETTGAVADRIFVGDRDGRMWRVDVSSRDPANWSMRPFFDAFWESPAGGPQPVILPPVLSTDTDGAVTVAFATGDQQVTAAPKTMINRVVSLTEKVNKDKFSAQVNWVQTLGDGFRVTGPMQIFNKGLYFAASAPPKADGSTCFSGSAQVWATDYIESMTPKDPRSGPGFSDQFPATLLVDSSDSGVVFGLNLQADPTCRSTTTTINGDDSFGYGTVEGAKQVNPGKFYLSFTLSGDKSKGPSGSNPKRVSSPQGNGLTGVRYELNPPHVPVSFQSWALIYE